MKVYISYAHEDRRHADRCRTALSHLVDDVRVELTERNLQPGEGWRSQIEQTIETSDAAIILLSPGYLGSSFLAETELPTLLRRFIQRQRLIPVLVEPTTLAPVHYRDDDDRDHKIALEEIQFLGGLDAPLSWLSTEEQDKRWAECADLLSSMAKTRTIRVPDIAWMEVPAGSFVYGERGQEQTTDLDGFWISKYPITNVQYQSFVDDGGYEDERWWHDLVKPEPEAPEWSQPNRPRTNVDWYEAVAFCRWLSSRLDLNDSAISLPTKQQWEKSARGEQGLIYPWGNEYLTGYANVDETREEAGRWNLGQTTAVGMYPQGESLYGVCDLSGTVWEWCLNKIDSDIVTPDRSGDERVLRGGSWNYPPNDARSVTRHRLHPESRHLNRGFRVVSSTPALVP